MKTFQILWLAALWATCSLGGALIGQRVAMMFDAPAAPTALVGLIGCQDGRPAIENVVITIPIDDFIDMDAFRAHCEGKRYEH